MINRTLDWLGTAQPKNPSQEQLLNNLSFCLEELSECAEAGGSSVMRGFIKLLEEKAKELGYDVLNTPDTINELMLRDGVADTFVTLGNITYHSNLPTEKDYDLVMDSNYTKFCDNLEDAEKSVELYGQGLHPTKMGEYVDAFYEFHNDYYIIKRRKDNKILKSYKYQDPLL